MTLQTDIDSAAAQLKGKTPQEVLTWALGNYDKISLASSFGAEDVALIDMIAKIKPDADVFTLDTGRLNAETYEVIAKVQQKYPQLQLRIMFPQAEAVEQMVSDKGINLFYDSVENRKQCCFIRKVEPLGRATKGLNAWITGLRRDQTANRSTMETVELDGDRNIAKINPLIDWTNEQVWEYIHANGVPYNALHDQNFPSIGCAPCTRAVEAGEDLRAGRWWWEMSNQECGLHVTSDGRLVRAKGE
ncbi:MAG: phosphoadenylyl-sulfate reductase [Pseudanabaena sp.]|jgi:phosphoadenosine phosphosulfate reductase|nr:phosphoadenylyl-sulfate reductase [Pseudanabaena sp. M090S1SP2A07QC]MCA6505428.1 phosphoadenylyl-sulfate reductase [Pseudanabaena sp. M172S2SP2A07QC]MCA6510002.1 phosphoadenylyl-sulfate reductase [Pseudanabaena sp. M109S1SP2A07QC]MCA6523287.1 phosphoadenylyl-sulfate reductase [Pseudanabaena sp. M051S1SP2A07QC]MCA6526060.1 phosphoadenylyl-sulfate reductase [Pseudanabaena sp. M179S2SP2A07QC]MCA6528988.1 phosphoadenylyl-sulfate reductase [Pseudanabaena sp. M125S2SP2A07QC]MCA6535330.1 phosphoa